MAQGLRFGKSGRGATKAKSGSASRAGRCEALLCKALNKISNWRLSHDEGVVFCASTGQSPIAGISLAIVFDSHPSTDQDTLGQIFMVNEGRRPCIAVKIHAEVDVAYRHLIVRCFA